jgi:hypothetical protein
MSRCSFAKEEQEELQIIGSKQNILLLAEMGIISNFLFDVFFWPTSHKKEFALPRFPTLTRPTTIW